MLDEHFALMADAAHDSGIPPPNPGAGVLLTADEVAALLRVSKAWVYAQTRAGQIPHVRLGRHVRYRLPAIESWVEDVEEASRGQRAPATTRNGRAPGAPAP